LIEYVNETTAPWILLLLGALSLITIAKTFSSWRQVKRSPYFFLRQQAEKRLQGYMWATFLLIASAGGTLALSQQAPPDNTVRMALLANAKPAAAAETAPSPGDLPVISLDSPAPIEISARGPELSETLPISAPLSLSLERPGAQPLSLEPVLPDEFNQVEATAELTPTTEFTRLIFSTEINDDYDPISPRRTFVQGFFTIYATFDYQGMADGMEWAWVWRRDGEVVNGGNELWEYGSNGPGWIYYEPPEGFSPGEYTLEVWVNEELFQQASLTIENEVANQ